MADIITQFHALPEELRPLLVWATTEFPVHLTALRFFPFKAVKMGKEQINAILLDQSIEEVAFTLEAPNLACADQGQFMSRHPDALYLDIGRLSERGLEESCLSCRIFNAHALGIWKKIARKLKSMTRAGVVVINPDTGASGKARNHRYTPGAKALDEKGVPIRPLGGQVLHLGLPAEDK